MEPDGGFKARREPIFTAESGVIGAFFFPEVKDEMAFMKNSYTILFLTRH